MKCPYCESQINDTAKFCPICGSTVSSAGSPAERWQQPSFGDEEQPSRPEPQMSFGAVQQPRQPVQPDLNIRPQASQPLPPVQPTPQAEAASNAVPTPQPAPAPAPVAAKKGSSSGLSFDFDIKKILGIILVVVLVGYLVYDYYHQSHFDFKDEMIGEWTLTSVLIDDEEGAFGTFTGNEYSHMTITEDSIDYAMSKPPYAKVNDGETEWSIKLEISINTIQKDSMKYKSGSYQFKDLTSFVYSEGKIKQRVNLDGKNAIFIWEKV